MSCPCNCCNGACCYLFAETPQCSITTCQECAELEGDWQGPQTSCSGDESDECPCEPAADYSACERCKDGEVEQRCEEGQYCCDGVCQDDPCEEPECESDEDCEYHAVTCSCDPEPPAGTYPLYFRTLEEALAYEPPENCGACTADPAPGYCCEGVCQEEPCQSCQDLPDCPGLSACQPGGSGAACDFSGVAQPLTGTFQCAGGEPTQVTVTISGYDASGAYGDAGLESWLNGVVNTSYVVDIDPCSIQSNEEVFQDTYDGVTYNIAVQYDPYAGQAGISVGDGVNPALASGSRFENNGSLGGTTECGLFIYDCPMVSGAVNGSPSGGDWSSATIDVT